MKKSADSFDVPQPAPADSEAVFSQAVAAHQAGKVAAAEAAYLKTLEMNPQHLPALINASSLYIDHGKFEQAQRMLDQALAIDEAQPVLHYNYGRIQMQNKMPEAAVKRYDRAIELSPQTAVFYSNRGIALFELNAYGAAIESYSQAIALEPTNASFYCNRGNAYTHVQQFDAATADYQTAVRYAPAMGDAHFNWALIDLMQGRYAEGWARHEWRWKAAGFARDMRMLTQPLWLGDAPLQGKTIYIYPEQGLGDMIQCARYIPLLEARGANVLLEVPSALTGLLATVSKTVTIITRGTQPPPFDLQCPIMSLPLAFKTTVETIPASTPYLQVSSEKRASWKARLGEKTRPRVGLVWSGLQSHLNDRNRSVALAQLQPLFDLPLEFHGLQKEVRNADAPYLRHLIPHMEALHDFTDTAALVEAMDIVVCVDTSVAHLAGALDKPVWLLLPAIPDFRWLLMREDSPWYPSARLFRQEVQGQWDPVIARVRLALEKLS